MADTPSAAKTIGGVILEVVLWVLGVLGVFCILCFAAAMFFNVRPLLVSTGSMEPMFGPNSVVFAQEIPAEEAQVGDVTAIQTPDMTIPVIHRVIEIDASAEGLTQIRMQGDANDQPDSRTYGAETVEKYLFHVPGLASAIAWLSTPKGFTMMAIPVPILFGLIFWPWGESRREREAAEAEATETITAEKAAPAPEPAPKLVPSARPRKPLPPARIDRPLPAFNKPAEKVNS